MIFLGTILNIFKLFATLVAPFMLQNYLSRKKNKYFGLLIPIAAILHAIWIIFYEKNEEFFPFARFMFALVFLIFSLITFLMYRSNRKKIDKETEIEKMSIKNL